MRQARNIVVVLVPLLRIDARGVGETRLYASDQVTLAAAGCTQAVVGALVLERVVQVEARPVGVNVVRADLAAGTEIAVGYLEIETEPLRYLIRAAEADTTVVVAISGHRRRALSKAIRTPAIEGVITDLHDGIGSLTFVLSQWHDRGVIDALVLPDADAHVPLFVELVSDIDLVGRRLDTLLLNSRIGFHRDG